MKPGSSSTELSAQAAAVAIGGAIAAVTVAECVFRVLYDSLLRTGSQPGLYLIYAPPVLVAILAAIPFAYIYRQPAGAWVLSLAAVTSAVFVVVYFRGSHRWVGFYDAQEFSRWPFICGWIGATVLAAPLSRRIPIDRLHVWVWGIIGLSVFWAWLDAFRGLRLIMLVPYTRHVAVVAVAVIVLLTVLVQRWGEQRGQ